VTRRWPVTGVALAVLWVLVRGVSFAPTRLAEELIIGLLVGLPVAFAVRRFYGATLPVSRTARVIPSAALYLVVFLKELLTANVDVARRVISPSLPIEPAVVEVPLRVRSDVAITTIANSITLTPGTLTMDYDSDTNTLYVHSIDGSDRDAVIEPIRRWEDYALVIFDEELKPGDPVPRVRADGSGGGSGKGCDPSPSSADAPADGEVSDRG